MAVQKKSNVPLEETRKRATVLTRQRETVLISIPKARLLGLPEVDVDKEKRDYEHRKEAERRGLIANAYRPRPDTGYCVIENAQEVSLQNFLIQLMSVGLYYCGGKVESWLRDDRLMYKTILEFSRDQTKEQQISRMVRDEFSRYVFSVFVWANWRFRDEELGHEGGQYRLDTINCPDSKRMEENEKPERYLNLKGNTYEIVEG